MGILMFAGALFPEGSGGIVTGGWGMPLPAERVSIAPSG